MKTKYSQIIKIKKNDVSKIERDIQKINGSIAELEHKIASLKENLASFSLPQTGNFSIFRELATLKKALQDEIKRFENQLLVLNSRKQELLDELKKAQIEYEKMNYLHTQEIKKMLKEKHIKESQMMDEIAIMLNKKREDEK